MSVPETYFWIQVTKAALVLSYVLLYRFLPRRPTGLNKAFRDYFQNQLNTLRR